VKQVICDGEDLAPGQMVSAKLGPMPIVVVRTDDGQLFGLLDKCLHMGGQLSKGKLLLAQNGQQCGEYVEEQGRFVVKCPWHGYEYDLKTGATLFDDDLKLRTFAIREENGQIVAET
jgi:3-phenylpropionate/trans-cinnamate dioxygenase ferredoxin subunit